MLQPMAESTNFLSIKIFYFIKTFNRNFLDISLKIMQLLSPTFEYTYGKVIK